MKLRFTPRAVQDITEIAGYIRAEKPERGGKCSRRDSGIAAESCSLPLTRAASVGRGCAQARDKEVQLPCLLRGQ